MLAGSEGTCKGRTQTMRDPHSYMLNQAHMPLLALCLRSRRTWVYAAPYVGIVRERGYGM